MRKSTTLFFIIMLLTSVSIFAQRYTISGTVKDASTGEALIGASVTIPSLSTGNMAGGDGTYKIENIPAGTYEFVITYIGYAKETKNIKVAGNLTLNFTLESSGILLQETVVKGTRATLRETPVAFSSVSGKDLETKLASRDIPMELATTPSVFASAAGGGAGDATLYIRGFNQRNIAIMINGVPVNDMENKWVYWSNWSGLGDVTDDIQIQRGLGASPYSVNAIGGILNIMTKGVGSAENGFKFKSEYGSNNLYKLSFAGTQKISKNLSVTALVSRRIGDGYAEETYLKEWTYYFSVGGVFGDHSIEIQGVGSPQEHGQRPYYARQTMANWAKYGKNFNYALGKLHGGTILETVNKFHKPAFNVNWNWQISKASTLSTILYYSIGRGYGSGTTGSFATRTADNYGDYDKVWADNSTRIDTKYSTTLHKSNTILRNSVNNHDWFGLLSTFKTVISPEWTLNVGIDGRYYIGKHYREVRDLLGGDYYMDAKNVNSHEISTITTPTKLAKVGDKIEYYDDFHVRQFGGFTQVEYKSGQVSTFLNVSASTLGAKRIDYFLYQDSDSFRESAWQNFFGFTVKTGLNYNLDENNSVYGNFGYFSSAPIVNNIFSNNTNVLTKDAKNEKILSFEVGYALSNSFLTLNANAFYTKWKDRAFSMNSSVKDQVTGQYLQVNAFGANQLHKGIELEATVKIMRDLDLKVAGSLLDAKFENDLNAVIFPEGDPTKVTYAHLYTEGLYVSDGNSIFATKLASVGLNYHTNLLPGLTIFINPVMKYNGGANSYFDPAKKTIAIDKDQTWKIPDYSLVDLHVGVNYYTTDFMIKRLGLTFHIFNLLNNTDYIVEAQDGGYNANPVLNHAESTATVFYGRERWMNLQLQVGF